MGDFDRDMLMTMLGMGCVGDWIAVFTFFAVALTYFLAPVIGYGPERRGSLTASLYLMLSYVGLSVLQFGVLFLSTLDGGGGGRRGPDELARLALFAFAILKLLFFFLALLLYVLGLHSLRLARRDVRRDDYDEPRYGDR